MWVATSIHMAQNGSESLGAKNLLKIVSCAESEKLQELLVRVQIE